MTLKRGYAEHGDTVILTVSREDFEAVVLALGIASGVAARDGDKSRFEAQLQLANRLNEGNKRWKPYERAVE